MGIWLQHLWVKIKRLKNDISKKKGLLLAAVVLFCALLAIFSPLKGLEQLIYIIPKSSNISAETAISNNYNLKSGSFLASGAYLTANTLASVINEPDTNNNSETEAFLNQESSLVIVQKNALANQTSPLTFISQKPRTETITYVVQEGDMPSVIAAAHGISINTLLWANKLNSSSIIRPGDELIILPVTGVLHRVKSGDTISTIAKQYNAKTSNIISFNDLPADGAIVIGQKLVIPDGRMPAPTPVRTYSSYVYTPVTGPGTGKSRSFPWGQCTWYVAQKTYVPWSGHAKSWLSNARAYGFKTGSAPQTGAIMVLTEGGWMGRLYGHVAYVESVSGNWVTISEMNYRCLGCKSVRTLHINDSRIRGYIY